MVGDYCVRRREPLELVDEQLAPLVVRVVCDQDARRSAGVARVRGQVVVAIVAVVLGGGKGAGGLAVLGSDRPQDPAYAALLAPV